LILDEAERLQNPSSDANELLERQIGRQRLDVLRIRHRSVALARDDAEKAERLRPVARN
jgi:hypothetical protein